MSYVSSVSSDVMAYEPATTSGSVNFTGLGNGTDFNEIIDAQIEAESYALDTYEAKLAETESCITLLENFTTSVGELDDALDDLNSIDEFIEMSASVSDDAVECEVTGEVQESTHSVEVNQLAQNDIWVNTSVTYSEPTDIVTTVDSTFVFECGGEEISVDIPANSSVQDMCDIINADPVARDYVEADVLYDGDEYFFRMTGLETGESNAVTLSDTTTLAGYETSQFTHVREAQNAQIKVDGFPAEDGEWMERESNTVDDVISGVELTLADVTTEGPVTMTLTYDTEATQEKIETFVEEVNSIIYDLQALSGRITTYVEDEESGEQVEAYTIDSYTLDIVYNEIKSLLSMSVVGFNREEDTYNALSQIGLYTDTDEGSDTFGQILIDDEMLEAALDEDPYAVASLFSCENTGESDMQGVQVVSTIGGITQPGEYELEYNVVGGEIVSATFGGEEMEVDGNTLTVPSGHDAAGMVLQLSDLSEGSHSGSIRVKEGVIPQFQTAIDGWTNAEDGSLTLLRETYDADVTKLENEIYSQEERLDQMESDLRRRYSVLDSRLAYYTNVQASLTSMISSL